MSEPRWRTVGMVPAVGTFAVRYSSGINVDKPIIAWLRQESGDRESPESRVVAGVISHDTCELVAFDQADDAFAEEGKQVICRVVR